MAFAAEQKSSLRALNEDRRRHQRVKVNLLGRYMLADRRETKREPASALPAAASVSEEAEDKLFSENPDRGHAES